jgi:lipopolysaccharide/colanic/teichoic acid biosynthesis glycosyltransferase
VIRLDSPGSPFFVQERVGKDRRRFRMVKFRTMPCDYNDQQDREFMRAYVAGQLGTGADQEGALFKPVKKEHVTRVGKFLRKSSLDELPQLFNILKGEMSLVGPRPNVPWEVESYHDWHYERLAVLPGITGLAQVNGRSTLPFDQIVTYDIEYVRNLTWQMDTWILWRTFWIAIRGSGAG